MGSVTKKLPTWCPLLPEFFSRLHLILIPSQLPLEAVSLHSRVFTDSLTLWLFLVLLFQSSPVSNTGFFPKMHLAPAVWDMESGAMGFLPVLACCTVVVTLIPSPLSTFKETCKNHGFLHFSDCQATIHGCLAHFVVSALPHCSSVTKTQNSYHLLLFSEWPFSFSMLFHQLLLDYQWFSSPLLYFYLWNIALLYCLPLLKRDFHGLFLIICRYVSPCGYVQARGIGSLELELPMVVSCLTWMLGIKLWFPERTASASNYWAISHLPNFYSWSCSKETSNLSYLHQKTYCWVLRILCRFWIEVFETICHNPIQNYALNAKQLKFNYKSNV